MCHLTNTLDVQSRNGLVVIVKDGEVTFLVNAFSEIGGNNRGFIRFPRVNIFDSLTTPSHLLAPCAPSKVNLIHKRHLLNGFHR